MIAAQITPAQVRALLREVLCSSSDFSAFALDYFRPIYDRFTEGMDRVQRVNLLLEHASGAAIVTALRQYAPQRCASAEAKPGVVAPSQQVCAPYRGLRAFDVADASLFFGRTSLIDKLYYRFRELHDCPGSWLLPILGPSGSGKSSVARAGLLALLQRQPVPGPQSVHLTVVRPGSRPIEALARALRALSQRSLPEPDPDSLRQLIKALSTRGSTGMLDGLRLYAAELSEGTAAPLVILVDQMEELYTARPCPTERDIFIELLLHAADDSARQVAVILTLRTDFVREVHRHHQDLARLLGEQAVLVPPMTEDELRAAIEQPALMGGRPLEVETIHLLLEQARGNENALPLLEFSLAQVWQGLVAKPSVKADATLTRIGGVGGALAEEAARIYGALSLGQQATARRAFRRMVNLGYGTRNTRRRALVSELCGQGNTPEQVLDVLRQFSREDARLVTLAGDLDEQTAELTHEALLDHWVELRSWIHECRADRPFHDRLSVAARLWDESQRPVGSLWRPPDLDRLKDYALRRPDELNEVQVLFLRGSERQLRYERRFRWSAAAMVGLMIIAGLSFGLWLQHQRTREAKAAQEREEAAKETIRQQLLSTYMEKGRVLLIEKDNPIEAALWLSKAHDEGLTDPGLRALLRQTLLSVDTMGPVLLGHVGRVYSAEFSQDGRRVVTASHDTTARIWDVASGRLVATLRGHKKPVRNASFSPDGRYVVTASEDQTARVWNADNGIEQVVLRGHQQDVNRASFSPDGRHIVTASWDDTARIWAADSGKEEAVLRGHGGDVNTASYSPDGRRIVTASDDTTARVWDTDGRKGGTILRGHGNTVRSARFSPDGHRVVTASWDDTARLWDADNGKELVSLQGHTGDVTSASFSPDGRLIVTTSEDQTARVWDADSGEQLSILAGHQGDITGASFSLDGQRIVTASGDKTARVWDAHSGNELAVLRGHRDSVRSAGFSADGRQIVTASLDQTARLWDADISKERSDLREHQELIWHMGFSVDGRSLVTASHNNTARVWDVASGRLVATLREHEKPIRSATISLDGQRIVTASEDQTARIWETNSGKVRAVLHGHRGTVVDASFSSDGRRVVTASEDQTARVWDADGGIEQTVFHGHQGYVASASFSPDGQRVVTASFDYTARVWNTDSGTEQAILRGHQGPVTNARFSTDGQRIVTASEDKTARVWDANTGLQLGILQGHDASVRIASFSPDGRRIVTASEDQTARMWDASSGTQLSILQGHDASVQSARFSPDGKRIVTVSDDQTARVWDVKSGMEQAILRRHHNAVRSLILYGDGQQIVTIRDDRATRVWMLAP